MQNQIPRRSKDCRYCQSESAKEPCSDHPNGVDYTGTEMYQPSEWIKSLLGQRFNAVFEDVQYRCTGYDPRAGIWMDAMDGSRRTNISERAIGATWHRVQMKWGSWRLFDLMIENQGRMVSKEAAEKAHILFEMAQETLLENGLIEPSPEGLRVSLLGMKTLVRYSSEERYHLMYLDFNLLDPFP